MSLRNGQEVKSEESEFEESSCDDEDENTCSSLHGWEDCKYWKKASSGESTLHGTTCSHADPLNASSWVKLKIIGKKSGARLKKKLIPCTKFCRTIVKKFEQLSEDMDLFKSDAQMMDRLNICRNRSNRVLSKRPIKPAFKELKTQLEASLEKTSPVKKFESKDTGLCCGYTTHGSSLTNWIFK